MKPRPELSRTGLLWLTVLLTVATAVAPMAVRAANSDYRIQVWGSVDEAIAYWQQQGF